MQAPASLSSTKPAYFAADSDPLVPVPSLGYTPDQQPQLGIDETQYSQRSHEAERTLSHNAEAHVSSPKYTTNESYYTDQEKAKNEGGDDPLTGRVQFAEYGMKDEKRPKRRLTGACICSSLTYLFSSSRCRNTAIYRAEELEF